MYKSNNVNFQNAPGIIQLKRDVVYYFNHRYDTFYERQNMQQLPYNVNPWNLFPRN